MNVKNNIVNVLSLFSVLFKCMHCLFYSNMHTATLTAWLTLKTRLVESESIV